MDITNRYSYENHILTSFFYPINTIGTDDYGCTAIDSVAVFVNSQIELTADITEEVLGGDGAIDLTVTGGTPGYTFDWDNDETGLESKSHLLQLTTDKKRPEALQFHEVLGFVASYEGMKLHKK